MKQCIMAIPTDDTARAGEHPYNRTIYKVGLITIEVTHISLLTSYPEASSTIISNL